MARPSLSGRTIARAFWLLSLIVLSLVATLQAVAGANAPTTTAAQLVGVCHRTHSAVRPWVFIRVSASSLEDHREHGDIIGVTSLAQCFAAASSSPSPVSPSPVSPSPVSPSPVSPSPVSPSPVDSPSASPAPQITLAPLTATNTVGEVHTVTATVTMAGAPAIGETVCFDIISGPNEGRITCGTVTAETGEISVFYVGTEPGRDVIQATVVGAGENVIATSNTVEKIWVAAP